MTGSTGGLGIFKFVLLVLGALSLIQLVLFFVSVIVIWLTMNSLNNQADDLNALIQLLERLG